jgi:hypothetical protein
MKSTYNTPGRVALAAIIVLGATAQQGCRDTPTAPATSERTPVSGVVNAPGDPGAPELIFLAPLGPRKHPRGELDTTLAPSIAICRLDGDACGADTLAHFSSDSSADSTHRITVSERAYGFRWKLKGLPADPAVAYRIVATLGDTTVGFTDLRIIAPDYAVPPEDTSRFAFITERNALNVRFQIFVPPVTLTVISEPGVHGDLVSQTYTFRKGARVAYDFSADSGYRNLIVTLDQNTIGNRGRITMDDSHVMIASADRETGIAPGDEWILHDSRALLRAANKVKAAQQLLTKLDEMSDTTNIAERLRRVEMTVLQRDADAAAMPALDAALAGHTFAAGTGGGTPGSVGGGGGGGGGGVASSLLIPLAPQAVALRRPLASVMSSSGSQAEPLTIAYVNGILTTPLGALFAAHHVAAVAREAQWNVGVPFEVRLMYNRSAMAGGTSVEDRCVLELGITGDWLGLNSLPGEVAKCINGTQPAALALLADFTEVGQEFNSVLNRSIITRPADVDSVAAFATRIRDEGRHIVFVMHSQGNLIVQQALTLLARRGQYVQSRDTTCIAGVALAAPTSEAWPIAARHLNGLAVTGDAILILGHNNFPRVSTPMSDSAARETTGSIRARIMGLASAASIRWGLRLHGAVESYLTPEPIRARVRDALVSSYRGCALGDIQIAPQSLQLQTGESGGFHAALRDLAGNSLDGQRGLSWHAESQSDWQQAVQLTPEGVATARYVGGTSVTALTRSVTASAGVSVSPAPLRVSAVETLSAQWILLAATIGDIFPIPPFVIPATGWGGGSCSEKAVFQSNGRTGSFSKQCIADYRVSADPFPNAHKYVAAFFEKSGTAALFTTSGPSGSLRGTIAGPEATMEPLPGPIPMDRIDVTALDAAGHLLASGRTCVRGCVGWPPDE